MEGSSLVKLYRQTNLGFYQPNAYAVNIKHFKVDKGSS